MRKFVGSLLLTLALFSVEVYGQAVLGGKGVPTAAGPTLTADQSFKYSSFLAPSNCRAVQTGFLNFVPVSPSHLGDALIAMNFGPAQNYQYIVDYMTGFYSIDRYAACNGLQPWQWPAFNEGPVFCTQGPVLPFDEGGGFELGVTYSGQDPINPNIPDQTTHWLMFCQTNNFSWLNNDLRINNYYTDFYNGVAYFIMGAPGSALYLDELFPGGQTFDQFHIALKFQGNPNWSRPGWPNFLHVWLFRAWDDTDPVSGITTVRLASQGFQFGFSAYADVNTPPPGGGGSGTFEVDRAGFDH